MSETVMERVPSIKVTDKRDGMVYELDFNREAIKFAEARGFKPEEVAEFPATKFPELFYYAFRMHHRGLSRGQTDIIYDRLGGVSPAFLERLVLLYNQALTANNVVEETSDMGKNGDMEVEL